MSKTVFTCDWWLWIYGHGLFMNSSSWIFARFLSFSTDCIKNIIEGTIMWIKSQWCMYLLTVSHTYWEKKTAVIRIHFKGMKSHLGRWWEYWRYFVFSIELIVPRLSHLFLQPLIFAILTYNIRITHFLVGGQVLGMIKKDWWQFSSVLLPNVHIGEKMSNIGGISSFRPRGRRRWKMIW